MRVTASLVLYHSPARQVREVVGDFLAQPAHAGAQLVIVDNSVPAMDLSGLPELQDARVRVVVAGRNLGFGAGHNLALRHAQPSDLHLLLNPDVRFGPGVLPVLAAWMQAHPDVGAVMPQVTYPDGRLQRLCRLLPTPMDLFGRRFLPHGAWRDRLNARYELWQLPQDRPVDVPILSGCFLLVRRSLLEALGGFDERYFMYMEDYDLVRRIADTGARTVYLPTVCVAHDYGRGSYGNGVLLRHHLRSAWRYFWKWGWWHDPVRARRNRATLQALAAMQRE
jgi:GT2 family glycosyltransferase